MTLNDLVGIMFRASQAQHGFLLRVSDPARAMRAFARAREESPEAELPPVRFRELRGHPEGNLVVLRGRSSSEAKSKEEGLF